MSKRQRRQRDKQRRHQSLLPTKRQLTAAGGLALGASLVTGATAAQAATYNVTNLNDSGSGSLRAALAANDANDNYTTTVDQIVFDSSLSGTISVGYDTCTPLSTFEAVNIQGPGAGQVTLQEVFCTYGPVFATSLFFNGLYDATISGLTITGGITYGSYAYGGGIDAFFADLTLQNVVIDSNYAQDGGGGIEHVVGDLTIQNSIVSNNFVDSGNGGGIATYASAATIQNSILSGNYATNNGGGIYQYEGSLAVQNSTVDGNGDPIFGGGILSTYGYGLTLDGSTISNNSASNNIAGVASYQQSDPVTVHNTTISGNSAANTVGGFYNGAVLNSVPPTTIQSSTIAGNSAVNDQGGVTTQNTATTLLNTIVSGNTAPGHPDLYDWNDDPFSAAFTLVQDPSGATINETVPGSNILGVDPQLGALAFNGGLTQTRALASTSPALDKGSDSGTDQRGLPRPSDFPAIPNSTAAGQNGADIGAFELQVPAPAAPAAVTAKCKGKTATIVGTASANALAGTSGRDVIAAKGGSDRVNARGGNDLVCGGGGKDKVRGGGGKDKEFGGAKKDRLIGNGGKDKLVGQGGKDTLKGGAGNDKLKGGAGADILIGGGGVDILAGGAGQDTQTQ